MSIPINIETFLMGKVVEGPRIEFKEGWNPKTIMRTVCAFATDEPNRRYFLAEIKIHPDFDGGDDEKDGGQIGLVEGLVESQKKMVRIMIDNPSVTIKEMSETVGISTTSIDKNITALKKKGIVERVGSDSTGTWKINFPDKE